MEIWEVGGVAGKDEVKRSEKRSLMMVTTDKREESVDYEKCYCREGINELFDR